MSRIDKQNIGALLKGLLGVFLLGVASSVKAASPIAAASPRILDSVLAKEKPGPIAFEVLAEALYLREQPSPKGAVVVRLPRKTWVFPLHQQSKTEERRRLYSTSRKEIGRASCRERV